MRAYLSMRIDSTIITTSRPRSRPEAQFYNIDSQIIMPRLRDMLDEEVVRERLRQAVKDLRLDAPHLYTKEIWYSITDRKLMEQGKPALCVVHKEHEDVPRRRWNPDSEGWCCQDCDGRHTKEKVFEMPAPKLMLLGSGIVDELVSNDED